MNTEQSNFPWPHSVVDDVIPSDNWSSLIEFVNLIAPADIPAPGDVESVIYERRPEGTVPARIYDLLHEKAVELWKSIGGLEDVATTVTFEFSGHCMPKHTSTPNNIAMSVIIYVGPAGNWDKMKAVLVTDTDEINLPLVPNRALIFSHPNGFYRLENPYDITRKLIRLEVIPLA